MDLTPKTSTPWWKLLRCCDPSDDKNEGSNDHNEGKLSVERDPYTECSDTHGSWKSEILKEKEVASLSDTTATEEPTDEPTLFKFEENLDWSQTQDDFDISFWKFFAFMMLRNTLGVDYLSEIVHKPSENQIQRVEYDDIPSPQKREVETAAE